MGVFLLPKILRDIEIQMMEESKKINIRRYRYGTKTCETRRFLGTKCDFHVDEDNNIYMSRTQIGYALEYTNPSHTILVLHQRHKERLDKFSIEVRSS